MALIEGVGDEVTLLCAVVFLLLVVVSAWFSTHTSDRSSAQWSPPGGQDTRSEDGGGEAAAGGGHVPASSDDDGSSSVHTSPVVAEPSPRNDFTCNDHDATVRHRGPQTPGDPAGSQDAITLRLKFLNETERVVNVRLTDSVLHIKRSQFPGLEPRVRLIYQGQLLRDDSQTVASLQLTDGCVLHCHVSQHAAAAGSGGAEPSQDSVNIGSLMVPLFVLLLGMLWYCQLQYPHVFNATATACLGAMTLFVLVLVFSSYRR